jgi:hypothetical protein
MRKKELEPVFWHQILPGSSIHDDLLLFLENIVFTWVSAFKPSGTEVKLAFTHSTVSLPFFHLHSQNEGQSFGSRGDFWLQV